MARYKEAVCRFCRREGVRLYLKGDRCYSNKCALERKPYAPGEHGQQRKKSSEYSLQLREKQKVRRFYGVLENQFRHYFEKAERQKGVTGENLLRLLELRLDNVVYRLGFANSRAEARLLVKHGHFTVNGRKVNVPSFLVKVGDIIAVREKSKSSPKIKDIAEELVHKSTPTWLQVYPEDLRGEVLRLPEREDISDIEIQEHLIVERYSR